MNGNVQNGWLDHVKNTFKELKDFNPEATLKEAMLDNDQMIMVPIFIKEGEMIRIDTENNEYSSRVKT